MAPPAPLRYANEYPPDLDPAYNSPAPRRTLSRQPTTRNRGQKPTVADSQEPDIEWIPSFKTYRDRCLRRLKNGGLEKTLPEGFPAKLESPLAWEGSKLKKEEYIMELSTQEIAEIEQALQDAKCKFYWTPCFFFTLFETSLFRHFFVILLLALESSPII